MYITKLASGQPPKEAIPFCPLPLPKTIDLGRETVLSTPRNNKVRSGSTTYPKETPLSWWLVFPKEQYPDFQNGDGIMFLNVWSLWLDLAVCENLGRKNTAYGNIT